jgi:hypothetical protein
MGNVKCRTMYMGGGGQRHPPLPLYHWKRDPVPTTQEDGRAPGPVWTVAENFAPAGIWSPGRQARDKPLYQLRNPDLRAVKFFT